MMCGGVGDEKSADEEVQQLIEMFTIRSKAEKEVGKSFEQYKAVSYKSQVVSGTNFFVKVDIGSSEFVHLRVFRPLPHVNSPPSLVGVQAGKTETDPIEFF